MFIICFMLIAVRAAFVVDAVGATEYTVDVPRGVLRTYVDDVGLLSRNMPGVVSVEDLGPNEFLYRTSKELPLAGTMETAFRIRKITESDSLTRYESVDPEDDNYMSCTVRIHPVDAGRTAIAISLSIRLARENPSDVHWLAPVVGADFISARMTEDIEEMLQDFVINSTAELHERFAQETGASGDVR